jgi:ABC-2 type transport system permease protein
MTKLLAVVKREYIQRVRARMFIVTTILLPLAMSLFGLVPAIIWSIDASSPLKLVVVDGTGKLFERLRSTLIKGETNQADVRDDPTARGGTVDRIRAQNFTLEELSPVGRTDTDIRVELDRRIRQNEIDAYLILPPDLMEDGKAKFFRRNTGDYITTRRVQDALDRAISEQRLIDANVDAKTRTKLGRATEFETTRVSLSGQERDAGGGFALVFAVGFVMYLSVLLYGQVVLGAVIEEKETRIAEVLFSSIRPFSLMMGKLLGVSLVALTQLSIWGLAFGAFALYGVNALASRGVPTRIPSIPAVLYLYFVLFFLLGYFVYSTLYALVGSIVTTAQEGGQLAIPIVVLLVVGFYLFLPVSRSPDSSFAFWVSMFPFFAPIAMLVRIVTQTPPFWQIVLSLVVGFSTAAFLTWLSSRIYRMGMLMYGKRPSIPEVWRWVRSA